MTDLAGKRIFIVEDDTNNRVVFQVVLARCGASIRFDRWGSDALLYLSTEPTYDLVLLDLMLARGNNGFDIARQLRLLPAYEDRPIIAVSAAEPHLAIPKAMEAGFSGFIAKPIDDELFPQLLVRMLNGERLWAEYN